MTCFVRRTSCHLTILKQAFYSSAERQTANKRTANMLAIDSGDLDALRAQVSEEFGEWSRSLEITQAMIDQFAEISGDRQWIHTDVERAKKESPFGSTIAHGFLTLAIMPRIRPPQCFEVTHYKSVTNYGSNGFTFIAPITPGTQLRAKQRLVDVQEHRLGVMLISEVVFQAEANEKPALVFNLKLLYIR